MIIAMPATDGPVDDRDAYWCHAYAGAVLFDTRSTTPDSVSGYLRSMADDYNAQCAGHPMRDTADVIALTTARAKRDAYRDALRVLELATDAADRAAARYDEEHRARPV